MVAMTYLPGVVFLLSAAVSLCCCSPLTEIKLLQHCGQVLTIGSDVESHGIISLGDVGLSQSGADSSCTVKIDSDSDDRFLHFRYVGISFGSCINGGITVTENCDDPISSYPIFTSSPHFCGKCIWLKDPTISQSWSGLPPYQFDIKNVRKLTASDRFVFEFASAIGSEDLIWNATIQDPPTTCGIVQQTTVPPLPTTPPMLTLPTTSTQQSCPQNVTVSVPNSTTIARVTWKLPTGNGFSNITSLHPVGTHITLIPLPGTTTMCTFVITVNAVIESSTKTHISTGGSNTVVSRKDIITPLSVGDVITSASTPAISITSTISPNSNVQSVGTSAPCIDQDPCENWLNKHFDPICKAKTVLKQATQKWWLGLAGKFFG